MNKTNILELVYDGDPRLKQVSEPYDFNTPFEETKQLVLDMQATMRYHNGMGLSAIQVGKPLRMFIMESNDVIPYAYFNPKIIHEEEPLIMEEGCLSYPGVILKVERSRVLRIRYQDWEGNIRTDRLEGMSAKCASHEIDHLDGVTFDTKVSKLKLELARKKAKKR